MRPLVLLPLALGLLLFPQAAAAGTIIVKREPGLTQAERADVRADADVRLVEPLEPARMELVRAARGRADEALDALAADADVEYAVPNVRLHATGPPSDPEFGLQWGFANANDTDIDLPEAWDRAPRRGAGVSVAVVDAGVSAAQPEFSGRLTNGGNFVATDCPTTDPFYSTQPDMHGTHVAGTIAAAVDGVGTVGAAPAAGIVSERALDSCGSGQLAWILNAFNAAAAAGARVVNASLATAPGFGDPSIDKAFADVLGAHANVLYVVAAGNNSNDNDSAPVYPCNTRAANLICVGASTNADAAAPFSNYGPTSVDLFAPGTNIESTLPSGYGPLSGTSMASPHVAGAAALVRSQRPALSALEAKAALLGGADVKPAFSGLAVRPGRLNAARSVTDSDDDHAIDAADNCPVAANTDQADGDRDGLGDACDTDRDGDGRLNTADGCPDQAAATATGCPPGTDRDGDRRIDSADACPTERAATRNGCPLPALTSLSAKVKRRTATVRVRADRAATVRVTILRKRCRRGDCRWVRAARRTVVARDGSAKVTLRRLRRGRYRAVVKLSSRAGRGAAAVRRFRIQ